MMSYEQNVSLLPPGPDGSALPEPGPSLLPKPVLWVISVILLVVIVLVNQFGKSQEPVSREVVAPDASDPLLMQTKMAVKFKPLVGNHPSLVAGIEEMIAPSNGADRVPPQDLVRGSVALAELKDHAVATALLDRLNDMKLEPEQEILREDAKAIRARLDESIPDPDADVMAAFAGRHGWFARLLESQGKPETDPVRAEVLSGGMQLVVWVMLIILLGLGAFAGSIASIIVLIVRGSRDQLVARFERPASGSPLYLESLVLFLLLFAALHVGFPLIMGAAGVISAGVPVPSWVMTVQLLLQWSLMLTIFWPLARGVTWAQWKAHVGWATPRGTLREVGAGLVGYGASLPVLVLVVLLLLVVMMLKGEGDSGPPANPIAEVLQNASGINLLLLFGLMTIWAPVVEESLFRGVLYRDLRGWAPIGVAVLISGLWFGLMHGYSGIMLMPVITIGLCFGVIREWRGSIVPTVVAHAVHNFAIGMMAIGLFTALR